MTTLTTNLRALLPERSGAGELSQGPGWLVEYGHDADDTGPRWHIDNGYLRACTEVASGSSGASDGD